MPERIFENLSSKKEEKPPVLPVEKIPIGLLEYRPGSAAGRRIREYLIKRQEGKCAFCQRKNQPLNIDHIVPRSKGGSARIGNLAATCVDCNSQKADKPIERKGEPIFFYPENKEIKK